MINKFLKTANLSILGTALTASVYAQDLNTCKVQLAISSPPVQFDQNVAFNVMSDTGMSKSITLKGGSAPKIIDKLLCGDALYTISATLYSTPSNDLLVPPVGQCTLKIGPVALREAENSVSVVFPNDFICTALK